MIVIRRVASILAASDPCFAPRETTNLSPPTRTLNTRVWGVAWQLFDAEATRAQHHAARGALTFLANENDVISITFLLL